MEKVVKSIFTMHFLKQPKAGCLPGRKRQRAKKFIATARIGTLNSGNTFWIISAFYKALDCFLDMDDSVFTVFLRVLGVIVFFKGFEMILQYLPNDILFLRFIDGQGVLQKSFALYTKRRSAGFVLYWGKSIF